VSNIGQKGIDAFSLLDVIQLNTNNLAAIITELFIMMQSSL
jgi:hypothetical protein